MITVDRKQGVTRPASFADLCRDMMELFDVAAKDADVNAAIVIAMSASGSQIKQKMRDELRRAK